MTQASEWTALADQAAALRDHLPDDFSRTALDAALGLARRADGRRWLRTQLDDPAVPHMQLRRMVIALVEHGDASALRSWAQTQTHAAGLAQEVLVWLGE